MLPVFVSLFRRYINSTLVLTWRTNLFLGWSRLCRRDRFPHGINQSTSTRAHGRHRSHPPAHLYPVAELRRRHLRSTSPRRFRSQLEDGPDRLPLVHQPSPQPRRGVRQHLRQAVDSTWTRVRSDDCILVPAPQKGCPYAPSRRLPCVACKGDHDRPPDPPSICPCPLLRRTVLLALDVTVGVIAVCMIGFLFLFSSATAIFLLR